MCTRHFLSKLMSRRAICEFIRQRHKLVVCLVTVLCGTCWEINTWLRSYQYTSISHGVLNGYNISCGIKLYSLYSISWQQFGYVARKNSIFNNNMILGRNGIYVTWVAASFGNKDVLTLLLIVWHTAVLLLNKKPGWTILLIWQWFKYRFFFYIRRREVIEDKTFNLLQCVLLTRWGRDKIAAIF